MRDEARSECRDSHLDPYAERVESSGALALRGSSPAFEPALRNLLLLGFEPGLVTNKPQQAEVGIDLAGERRFKVEGKVRLPSERDVVAEEPQLTAVGH